MTRVLMLEDNDTLAGSIVATIEAAGHSVMRFRDLRGARCAIPPIGFDVLLCDHDLPDGTGIEFLLEVERSSYLGLDRWTAILWSGLGRDDEVLAAGPALADVHVLVKDVQGPRSVLDLIDAHAKRKEQG